MKLSCLKFSIVVIFFSCQCCKSTEQKEEDDQKERANTLLMYARQFEGTGNICAAIQNLDTIIMLKSSPDVHSEAKERLDRLKKIKENTKNSWGAFQKIDQNVKDSMTRSPFGRSEESDPQAQIKWYLHLIQQTASGYEKIDQINPDPELSAHIGNSLNVLQKHISKLQDVNISLNQEYQKINDMLNGREISRKEYQTTKYMIDVKYLVLLEPIIGEITTEEAALDQEDKRLFPILNNKYCLTLTDN